MKRPTGITIIAMFLFLNGSVLLFLAATLYAYPDIGARFSSAYLKHLFPSHRIDAANILMGSIIGGILSVVMGVRLWFLDEFARWGVLLAAGIPLGRGVVTVGLVVVMNPGLIGKIPDAFWLRMLVCGTVALYVTRPDVQNAFRGPDRYLQEIDPKQRTAGEES